MGRNYIKVECMETGRISDSGNNGQRYMKFIEELDQASVNPPGAQGV